jgi:hypothetical protein
MAIYVTLSELKARVYADDTTAYDTRLSGILDNAESAVIGMTDFDPKDVCLIAPEEFPGELKEAILQLAASWFAQPEGVAPVQFRPVPYGISFLVKPFERLAGGGRLESLIEAAKNSEG